jgi:dipeptidyl aminopeptidase/acylaminoacyl peptidase
MRHDGSMPFRDFVPVQRFQPSIAVSPDGTQVAFAANTSGQYDLWVAPVDGGDPRRVTDVADRAVRTVAWSPDGSQLAFTADRGGDEQHQVFVVDADSGDVDDGDDGGGDGDSAAPARRISTTDDRQHYLAGSPFSSDGRYLTYSVNDRDPMVQDLIVHDLHDDSIRRVESEPGLMLVPIAFSPDDRSILVVGVRSNTNSDACLVDVTVDVTVDEPVLDVVTAHDGEVNNHPAGWTADGSGFYLLTDGGGEFRRLEVFDLATRTSTPFAPAADTEWDVEEVATSEDGSVVVWTVNEDGRSVLHRCEGDRTTRIELPPSVLEPIDVTPDGRRAVALVSSATHPTELAVIDLTQKEPPRSLTTGQPPGLLDVQPVEPELVTFPTHDDRAIPAWLYRPVGEGPFPVVLSIHGGPEAQERPQYNYAGLYQYLLANGIGVLAPNVRGSSGYGRSYQTLIHRDWGGAELGDFEHANRYLRSLPWVDGERIGVFGGSYGGFATLSCVSRLPDLWAAGVSVVGPSNLQTFVRAVPPTWRALMASWVGDPDDDAELLAERSPLTYADQITVPLMVVQGANDPRVVQAESDQIVASLRNRGVDVRYEVYEDEGHGFTKRENEIDALGKVAEFLIDHLRVG